MPAPRLQASPKAVQLLIAMAYDGQALHGTAWQPHVLTAVGICRAKLVRHLHPTRIWSVCVAARLDAGVHCEFNLLSARLELADAHCDVVRRDLNTFEADGENARIRFVAAHAPSRLSARGMASSKTYRYVLEDGYGPAAQTASLADANHKKLWHIAPRLKLEPMQQAAGVFVGTHDFTAFAASPKRRAQTREQAVKTIMRFEVRAAGRGAHGGTRWHISCEASGLLRRQMRFMVASIVCAGAQLTCARTLEAELYAATPPAHPALQAPACGLYLEALSCAGPHAALVAQLEQRLQAQRVGPGAPS